MILRMMSDLVNRWPIKLASGGAGAHARGED